MSAANGVYFGVELSGCGMLTVILGAGETVATGGMESRGRTHPGRMTRQSTQSSGKSKRDVVAYILCIISNTRILSSTCG
jgi:hypothetical protein